MPLLPGLSWVVPMTPALARARSPATHGGSSLPRAHHPRAWVWAQHPEAGPDPTTPVLRLVQRRLTVPPFSSGLPGGVGAQAGPLE